MYDYVYKPKMLSLNHVALISTETTLRLMDGHFDIERFIVAFYNKITMQLDTWSMVTWKNVFIN